MSTALKLRIPPRVLAAWYCLRDRPVAYKITVENGGLVLNTGTRGGLVHGCTINGARGAVITINGMNAVCTSVIAIGAETGGCYRCRPYPAVVPWTPSP